jgi:nitrogen fixation protein NifU and related proteins
MWWSLRSRKSFCPPPWLQISFANTACLLDTAHHLHTQPMFSREVLDHFQNPRNAGELKDPTAIVDVSNPVCGDILKVAVYVENDRISQARFLCRGCTTSIACASRLTELLTGLQICKLHEITSELLTTTFGELPPETIHGAYLAAAAAQALAARLTSTR